MKAHYARVYRRGVVLSVAAALAAACAVDAAVLWRRLTAPVVGAISLNAALLSILPDLASLFAGVLCSAALWWVLWI